MRGVVTVGDSHCGNESGCAHPDAVRVRSELLGADVALGVGVVALTVGLLLYFTRPRAEVPVALQNRGTIVTW
jgi:hypothetical protein